MRFGYVSDEYHRALSDVQVEVRQNGSVIDTVQSSASGGLSAELDPGTYECVLSKDGYSSKRSTVRVGPDRPPHLFRLLSDGLMGYVWPPWTAGDESVEYRVHSSEPTKVTLWRYGGEKEFIRKVGWVGYHAADAGKQTVPDGDFTMHGVDWHPRHPAPFAAQDIEAPDRSGLYYVHFSCEESDEFFSCPWVVAPSEPASSIAVLSSTMTWNAYNSFGGRSNYVSPTGLANEPVVNPHQDLDRYHSDRSVRGNLWAPDNEEYAPVSFDRPIPFNHVPESTELTDPIEGMRETHGAGAEWRFLGWLERHGYGYDLYADNQLHDGTLDPGDYDVVIAHTHPEYWSERMYTRVKDWVESEGGRLLVLGGNAVDCEVEVIDEFRVRYRTHSGELTVFQDEDSYSDDQPEYDNRFHRAVESSAELVGSVTSLSGINTGAPYRVVRDSHWVFDDAGLSEGDCFGENTLQERNPGGASGQETDKRTPRTPSEATLLAKGTNPDDGGAEMLIRETNSGGAVFSVGSITYTASLLVDEDLSTVTKTVLDQFLDG